MICFNCDSDTDAAFFQEKFPCCHCDDENIIEYNACPNCGWMWRAINGVPQDDAKIHMKDFSGFDNIFVADAIGPFDHDNLTEEEQQIMANVSEHLEKVSKMDTNEASMSDQLHRCLNCESTAVDVNNGIYKCMEDDCGFEWEVVKFD
jgi:hypothetical protein